MSDSAATDADTLILSAHELQARLAGDPHTMVGRYRDVLAWGRERLYTRFREGAESTALVRARADFVDAVLRSAWRELLPVTASGLALVAVGGYGRRELLPFSDIDLLLLIDAETGATTQPGFGAFNAFLWDIGLEVGISTRTVADCVRIASDDVTVMTSLLEARLLCGDPALATALAEATSPAHIWPIERFYRAKLDEQARRHHKFDDTGYRLEPNVKESPGGLRDIHTIGWVATRKFGASSLASLRDYGFLDEAEYHELLAGEDFLWRVRFTLHMITGRHEDRLLFDYQSRVAALFGYENAPDDPPNHAVEQFMQVYYRTIKSLFCLNDLLLQLFDEAIVQHNVAPPPAALNERFQTRGTTIEAVDDDIFQRDPVALLEIFALMQTSPTINDIRAHTLRALRRDARFLDATARQDPRARTTFLSLFRHDVGLTRILRRMNRYGVLGQYLPEFGRIVGLMQYDLFHTLTVDEHSLRMVRNLRRMAEPRFAAELPFQSEVFKHVDRRDLLYIAGFLHDLAKGSGSDHSTLGAQNALRFCAEHGLPSTDGERVAWLVRNHLLMSLTAQRRDISDPEVVSSFAGQVGTKRRLDDLYLLTVADIRATNPSLWNAWRDSLLKELYYATGRALERGLDNPVDAAELVAEQRRAVLALLGAEQADTSAVDALWPRFGQDYYLRHTPRELAWQLRAIAATDEAHLPLVLVDVLEGRGTSVFVYMRDRDHLFTLTAGVLARLGLSILDARISTSAEGYTLDTWMVLDRDGPGAANPHRNAEIRGALHKVLSDRGITSAPVNRRISRVLRQFATPTQVRFRQDQARSCTVMELIAGDRPGLLATVGRALGRRGLRIEAAKIGTIGERAEDVFFITDARHAPVQDPALLKNLARALTRALKDDVPAHPEH
ncbi:MAG TPA: [protein-PII] uridylyltransferase [Nevskiaceae bacterium]|nr:[protein-PII] uridylyltransferase [Nevskiaceae bacterium]